MRTILSIAAATLAVVTAAHADIFQWEYINPADPSQGKRQSTTLCPAARAVPGRCKPVEPQPDDGLPDSRGPWSTLTLHRVGLVNEP